MTYLFGGIILSTLSLIGIAIFRRRFVKASLVFRSVGFSIEARDDNSEKSNRQRCTEI
jgi:hypothetical protein